MAIYPETDALKKTRERHSNVLDVGEVIGLKEKRRRRGMKSPPSAKMGGLGG